MTTKFKGWTMKVPVLSTGHISQTTMKSITTGYIKTLCNETDFLLYEEGVFISIYEDFDIDKSRCLPEDFKALLAWARSLGYNWVRLDRDGDYVDSLKVYEW